MKKLEMDDIILIGGGGHAISLLQIIKDKDKIIGYSDLKPNPLLPIPYLGRDEEVLSKYTPEVCKIHHAIVYLSDVNLTFRKLIINKFHLYKLQTFIAETSIVAPLSVIGDGCAIMHYSVVNGAKLGHNCVVNTSAVVEHNVILGNNVFIGPTAVIGGGVLIGDNVLIGRGALLRDGITICSVVVIGMGAVVVNDIKVKGVYLGVPAKLVENE